MLNMGFEYIPEAILKDAGCETTNLVQMRCCEPPRLIKGVVPFEYYPNASDALAIMDNIKNGTISSIVVKVDPDVDGYTSAAMFASFLELLIAAPTTETSEDLMVRYVLSKGKEHGIDLGEFDAQLGENWCDWCDLLVVPDAGSDPKSLKAAQSLSMPVLIIDHHPIDENCKEMCRSENIIMVNPYLDDVGNIHLTGAGLMSNYLWSCCYESSPTGTWLRLKWLVDSGSFGVGGAKEAFKHIRMLAALGQVADVSDLRDMEARRIVLDGIRLMNDYNEEHILTQYTDSLIAELFRINSFSVKHGATITSVGWYIAPPMNAVIRFGSADEKLTLFDALIWRPERVTVQYTPTKRVDPERKPIDVTLQWDAARQCRNAKNRQDKAIRELMPTYLESVTDEARERDSVMFICLDGVNEKNKPLTGLIANKLTGVLQRPVCLLSSSFTEDGVLTYYGSGRGYEPSGIIDLKSAIESSGAYRMLGGHGNAFGVGVTQEDIAKITADLNKQYPLKDAGFIPVDYEVELSNLQWDDLRDIANMYDIWGNHINQPVFAITNVTVALKDIESYRDGQTIVFEAGDDDIRFVKKYCGKDEYSRIQQEGFFGLGDNKRLTFTVIGTFEFDPGQDGHENFYYVKVSKWDYRQEEEDDELRF